MTYQIKDRDLSSILFLDSGLLWGFIFHFAFIFLLYLMIICWLIFVFVSMSLNSSLSNQEYILTYLLYFKVIIKLYCYYYGSITLYYNILYY